MPLVRGFTKKAARTNAIRLIGEGYPHRQAYKIALETARHAAKKRRLPWTKTREAECKKGILLGFSFAKKHPRGRRASK